MGFKFLEQNIPDQPEYTEDIRNNYLNGFVGNIPLTTDNRPAVFLQLNRNRDTFSDEEWSYLIKEQRRRLIEHMWSQGHIMHTIISQDENGLTLRTELLF